MVQCVSEVDEWLRNNMLKNNIDKLFCIYLSSPSAAAKPLPYPLVFGVIMIEPSKSARNLCVMFDEHLSMDQHVFHAARMAFSLLRCFSRVRKAVDEATCNTLVCALQSKLNRLQRVQNAAARLVVGRARARSERSEALRKPLLWLPVRERIDYKIATLTFKAVNNMAPNYLMELLKPHQPSRSLRSENLQLLQSTRVLLKRYGARSFSHAAPELWNSLPLNVRLANSLP